MKKLPPIEKVYEAWSALADGRVHPVDPNSARIESSDGRKTYTVIHDPATHTYASNDNATYWRGYPGYPVLAMMMENGTLPLDREYIKRWAGINWNSVNAAHKRDYASAVKEVGRDRGIDLDEAAERAEQVMKALESLPASTRRLPLPITGPDEPK